MSKDIDEIRSNIDNMSESLVRTFEEPITSHKHKGLLKISVIYCKRIIRKCTRFLLKPYAEKMFSFQENILITLRCIADKLNEMDKNIISVNRSESDQAQASNSGFAESVSISAVSNGTVDVIEAQLGEKRVLWAINSTDITDSISNAAREGRFLFNQDLLRIFPSPGTFIDIGANIGTFTIAFAAQGWNGYAFEASLKNADALRKSVVLNDYDVTVIEKAVYDKTGDIYFVQDGPWGFIKNNVLTDQNYEKISCISLDDWLDSNEAPASINLIKIDIEGSEVSALRGMRKLLARFDYPHIMIEMNAYALCMQGETQLSLLSMTSSMGYTAYELQGNSLYKVDKFVIPETFCIDYLLFKELPHELCCCIVERKAIPDEEYIAKVVDKLSRRQAWHELSRYGREECADNYGAYILYALKDYPDYYNHPEINRILCEIASESCNDPFISRALEWFS